MMCLQIFELDFDNKADVSIFLVKCPGHTKNIHDCWFNKNAHRKCRAEDKTS
uniref:Uncharacterized protein n=1 Tax=Romanomermis culicivorax TaxID=13658 RepID=A0A915KNY3_ROMCU